MDAARHIENIRADGYTILHDALSAEDRHAIRSELAPWLQGDKYGRNDFEGLHSERVYALLAKSPTCARMVEHPTVLLVEMEEARIPKLRPIWNLLCEQLFAHFLDSSLAGPGGRLPRPVSILMDEFASSIGRIPDMQVRLNTLRERRVSILAAVQYMVNASKSKK